MKSSKLDGQEDVKYGRLRKYRRIEGLNTDMYVNLINLSIFRV